MTESLSSATYGMVGNILQVNSLIKLTHFLLDAEDGNYDDEIAGPSSEPAAHAPAADDVTEDPADNVPEDGARSGEAVLG